MKELKNKLNSFFKIRLPETFIIRFAEAAGDMFSTLKTADNFGEQER
jgi:hypothetical protein